MRLQAQRATDPLIVHTDVHSLAPGQQFLGARADSSENDVDTALDGCILRYALARRSCADASCHECLAELSELSAFCLREPCTFAAAARGKRFVEHLRDFRFGDVMQQCMTELERPEYNEVQEMSCGSQEARTSATGVRAARSSIW